MQADLVRLDGSFPALRPCRRCGGDMGYLTASTGPHSSGVRCASCDRHNGWLPRPADDVALIED